MGCATFKSRSLPGYLMSGEVERGEALSTAGRPNLVRCAPNGTVVGPGVARDWPAQTSSKIYRELFSTLNCPRLWRCGVPRLWGAWCDRVLLRAMAYPFLVARLACLPDFLAWALG